MSKNWKHTIQGKSKVVTKKKAMEFLHKQEHVVHCYYKNDQEAGAGISVPFPLDKYNKFISATHSGFENLVKDKDAMVKEMFEKLDELLQIGKENWNDDGILMFIGCVYTLTKFGYLQNDEFNGILCVTKGVKNVEATLERLYKLGELK